MENTALITSLDENVRIIGQSHNNFEDEVISTLMRQYTGITPTNGVIATMLCYEEPSAMMSEQLANATMEGVTQDYLRVKKGVSQLQTVEDGQRQQEYAKTKIN